MYKVCLILFLFFYAGNSIAQTHQPCCSVGMPVAPVKAYIPGSDSVFISLAKVQDSITLTLSDTSYKVVEFTTGITLKGSGVHYYEAPSKFGWLTRHDAEKFFTDIKRANTIFIDRICIEKNKLCYCVKPIYFHVK